MEPDDFQQDQDQDAADDQSAIPAPPISTDNSQDDGPGPQPEAAIPDDQQTPTSGLLQDAQNTPLNRGLKDVLGYIMGKGAAPQQQADAAAAAVDPEGKLSPEDRNLLAVHQAGEVGGPGAAWAMVQSNRQAYNAKQSFARAALNGVDGKAGDVAAAADAATKAAAHLLDGSVATFKPDGGGVSADVRLPGQSQSIKIKLTPEQLNQYLDVGSGGQYDKVLQAGGVPQTLQQIAKGQGEPLKGPGPQANAAARPGGRANNPAVRAGHAIVRDVVDANQPALPGMFDKDGHYIGPPVPDNTQYGAQLESRSRAMFPGVSQEAQRQAWMAKQDATTTDQKNKIDIATAGLKAKEKIAGIQAGGKVQAAGTTAGGKVAAAHVYADGKERVGNAKLLQQAKLQADRLVAQANNARDRINAQNYRAELGNPNRVLMTDADVTKLQRAHGFELPPLPGAATPQVAPPTGQAHTAPNGAPTKTINGKTYYKGPDGKAVLVQ